jgi:hypothetical protein
VRFLPIPRAPRLRRVAAGRAGFKQPQEEQRRPRSAGGGTAAAEDKRLKTFLRLWRFFFIFGK